eukprot:9324720-Prorocentrum_lima.AAC.1
MHPIRPIAPSHFRNGSSERGSGVGSDTRTEGSCQWCVDGLDQSPLPAWPTLEAERTSSPAG